MNIQNNKRLKVLLLPAWYPTKKKPAWGVFNREQVKAISLYNDVVVLFDEDRSWDIEGLWQTISDKVEDNIRTIRIKHRYFPIPKMTYLIYLWSIYRAFRKLVKEGWKPDIIHAHIFSAGVPAVILGKIYKTPVVITEHWTVFPRHELSKLDIIKARFAINNAEVIISVSEDLKGAIKSYGIKNKFVIVPNPVNTKMFYPSVCRNRNSKKKILLVALLSRQKGVPYLLLALSRLKQKRRDFLLDIVGNGQNRKEYEELAKELKLDEVVKFHGLKTLHEVAEFMRLADFFVLPSLWENLPCVLIEAMASGLPIIASKVAGIPEIVSEKIGILVPPKDIDKLANAIDHMLDRYQDYSSNKISQYAKDKFSYETVGQKVNRIYREVLE